MGIKTAVDRKRILREMLFARRFEERCQEAYMERKIGGFLHLYPGQEACVMGVMEAARPGHDYVITGYRDHVHAIKSGIEPRVVMAELYGKETGCSKGRGGSMHLFDSSVRFMGGYALVGGPFPLAAGIALGLQRKREHSEKNGLPVDDAISICFLGDAANNQGTFHETMNMASLWKLPVLFICENNLYGIGTRIDRSTVEQEQYKRVSVYDIPAKRVDGQDLDIVYNASQEAVDHVRSGKGPYFLELATYRFRGHSMSDAGHYRSKDEEAIWKKRDPILIHLQRMIEAGEYTVEEYKKLDKEVIEEIENDCIKFAEESPEPKAEEVEKYLFAENDPYVTGGLS